MKTLSYLLAVVSLLLVAGSGITAAEEQPDIEFLFRLKHDAERYVGDDPAKKKQAEGFQALLKELLEWHRSEQRLSGSVAVGFDGDDTDRDSTDRYKLNTKIKLGVGNYPRQFRVAAGARIQLEDGEFEEDVTSILVNYDYYFRPWLESYGFIERFNDNFLSIQQRYEVGGGVKLEWTPSTFRYAKTAPSTVTVANKVCEIKKPDPDDGLPDTTDPAELYGDCLRKKWFTKKGRKALSKFANLPIKADDPYVTKEEDRKRLRALAGGHVRQAVRKAYSKLELGFAVSLLSEFEKAEIESTATTVTPMGPVEEKRKFAIDGEHRFRLVLRPGFVYRPNQVIELRSSVYFKHPLGEETKIGGEKDLRVDTHAMLKYKITEPVADAEKAVSLVLDYTRRHDRTPPVIDPQTIADLMAAGTTLDVTVAQDTHEIYALKLEVAW